MRTDAEARAFEREEADAIVARRYSGFKRCRGYPLDHYCIVLLPSGSANDLCRTCEERTYQEHRMLREDSVGRILESMPAFEPIDVCGCGGDRDGLSHEMSLLHLNWQNGGLQKPPDEVS